MTEIEEQAEHVRNESEPALRESELRYRRLFEAARDGILILNAESGRITDANPFLIELLGFSLPEMLGKTVGELSPFRDIEPNKVMLARLLKDGYVRYANLPLETRAGVKIPVEFVCNIYLAGHHNVIQCNIRSIAEQKQLEDKILGLNKELEQRVVERSAQVQAANDELERFSYSVSHDLRAPLREVTRVTGLLEKDAWPLLSETSRSHVTSISKSALRMGLLIDDLLAFSRAANMALKKADVDLDELVKDVISDFKTEQTGRNIDWILNPLPHVQADRALLRMVLVNLVSNAVKFTGTRAEAKIEIGFTGAGTETVIYIRDNGAGFDPRFAEKLFGVFQRLHRYEEFEGTGIGLANVQRIILRHGGRAWASGILNGGATFYFSLPNL